MVGGSTVRRGPPRSTTPVTDWGKEIYERGRIRLEWGVGGTEGGGLATMQDAVCGQSVMGAKRDKPRSARVWVVYSRGAKKDQD